MQRTWNIFPNINNSSWVYYRNEAFQTWHMSHMNKSFERFVQYSSLFHSLMISLCSVLRHI